MEASVEFVLGILGTTVSREDDHGEEGERLATVVCLSVKVPDECRERTLNRCDKDRGNPLSS